MNKKTINIILLILLFIVLLLSILIVIIGYNKEIVNIENYKKIENNQEKSVITKIYLEDDNTRIDGEGVTQRDNNIIIGKEGIYEISGTLTKGQIIIQTLVTSDVELRLAGVNITSIKNSPINCRSAKSLTITLVKNTENFLTDTANYVYEDTADEEPNATLFSKANLKIRGEGSLFVNSKFMHGISSKDNLVIESGNLDINSIGDGIRGTDSVLIIDGKFNIKCGGDGIRSSSIQKSNLGYIVLENGEYNIEASCDGIQAETNLNIYDGKYNIKTQGNPFGEADSQKGIKANELIEIKKGNFVLNTIDDAIHSNNDLKIHYADMEIHTSDDAIHSEGKLIINDGNIEIKEAFEGIEGLEISIFGGNININTRDDGISAVGNGKPSIEMFGGYVNVFAHDDGIDINDNGDMYFRGGTLILDVSENMKYGPMAGSIDFPGTFYMLGGTMFGIGNNSNVQFPGKDSKYPTLVYYLDDDYNKEIKITIEDENGNELFSYSGLMGKRYIEFSSEKLEIGKKYKIITDDGKEREVVLTELNNLFYDDFFKEEIDIWIKSGLIVK